MIPSNTVPITSWPETNQYTNAMTIPKSMELTHKPTKTLTAQLPARASYPIPAVRYGSPAGVRS
jgi:hypothetical protein